MATVVNLLTDDVLLTMPPLPLAYQGKGATGEFLEAICATRHFRLIPTRANGQPALGCYVYANAAVAHAHGLIVRTLTGNELTRVSLEYDRSWRLPTNAELPTAARRAVAG